MAFFELRQYRVKPGQNEAFVKLMDDEIIPFQLKQGMTILGSFTGQEDDGLYVWIRRFESEEERERLYKAVYQSDFWKTTITPRLPELMESGGAVITRIEATPKSAIQ